MCGIFSTTYQQGILCPLRILSQKVGRAAASPTISREKDSGLPPVTPEKTSCPSRYCKLFDALSSRSETRAALLWKKIGTLPYKNRELAQNRVNPMQKWV